MMTNSEDIEVTEIIPEEIVARDVRISRHGVAVDQGYFWSRNMTDCPVNSKVQLLSKGGLPGYGEWDGKNPFYVRWAPLPKLPPDEDMAA